MGWMARPDRWVSWQFDAIRQGLRLIEEFKPDVIWSTYPATTAHVIASKLHRKTGIPWVAVSSSPWPKTTTPPIRSRGNNFWILKPMLRPKPAFCVFTTPGAARIYQQRYPTHAERMVVLENGYDEESFSAVKAASPATGSLADGTRPLIMLHSGIVYPSERDPTQLFQALGNLHKEGTLSPADLRVRFRASVHDDLLQSLAQAHGAQDFIELCPAVPYREALAEMLSVDALLVMQASNCNAQIPAKIYEYLRAGKPILGLTDPAGDTAGVLRGAGLSNIARLDSSDEIATAVVQFVKDCRTGSRVWLRIRNPCNKLRNGRSQSLCRVVGKSCASSLMSTRRSLFFSFLDRYASLLISVASSMVIARLLTPADIRGFGDDGLVDVCRDGARHGCRAISSTRKRAHYRTYSRCVGGATWSWVWRWPA